ncbi:MAG: tRNA (cytidine(34)-2'-O)-methyltransferase [Victivallales bacterium]|jgi:tRNA (cytidine/uridine-2'-O-)-methyltransferase|nr:tRNA (cytidine(34)-2'-O)-methyltransferase [Victivallales bacterium]
MKPFNIVLFAPEIPQNTGTIGRLCVSTDTKLHLIKPLGFSLDEKHLRRAGMDYWQYLDLTVYENWEEFLSVNSGEIMYFISTKGKQSYWDIAYPEGCFLIFGRESGGLPPEFYDRYRESLALIPMEGEFHRSLNLANAASIVLYEALRQQKKGLDL